MNSAMLGYDPQAPWNGLPHLPPASGVETPAILKACISARAELARVDALVETLPNKGILIQTIPLQEARSSSEIENIMTTSDALYQALASDDANIDANTKEVLRYREALWEGVTNLSGKQCLNIAMFEKICSRIRDMKTQVRGNEPVGIINKTTKSVIYIAPNGKYLSNLLTNLEGFIANDEDTIDPLIKMAVIHYQFEAIHPFKDGNGRTGRVLNILYLMRRRLLSAPVLYLSRFFIEHRNDYYRYLRSVTEEMRWEQWILFVLNAVEHTSRDTAVKIDAMRRLIDKITSDARAGGSNAVEREGFVELLFKWPYCKIGIVTKELGCSRITATRYLNEIADLGLIERIKLGRELYYINTELMTLLAE